MRRSRAAAALALLVAATVLAPHAGAQPTGSIEHEFVPPDPGDDLSLAATTLDGDLPAAIETPSGVVIAPDPRRPPDANRSYGNSSPDDAVDSRYEPDRDTRRPHVESYDDPFLPGTAPFKRLRAYDAVDADYTLRVLHTALRPLPVGGQIAAGDEAFYGDMSVDLVPGQPVRIPTVGPGARVLRMHATPEVAVELLHDEADNWFARSSARQKVRLVVELAIARDTFGKDFADVDWADLKKHIDPGASSHKEAFAEVAQAVGISRAMRPKAVVEKMVAYFRAFAPSDDPPKQRGDIYLDLALSKKGVCRHRAFAFLVTALEAGIPSRMVVNEAHAWVEIYDGVIWHRVDLGGAAANLEDHSDGARPPYVPPPDPYDWPASRDSGQDLADKSRQNQASDQNGNGSGPGPASSNASPSSSAPQTPDDPSRPRALVTVAKIDRDVRRGLPLHVAGEVKSSGGPCARVRIDVVLRATGASAGTVIGSLSTDDRGAFDGAVVVPQDVALGDYDLVVATPGDARCGPSE